MCGPISTNAGHSSNSDIAAEYAAIADNSAKTGANRREYGGRAVGISLYSATVDEVEGEGSRQGLNRKKPTV